MEKLPRDDNGELIAYGWPGGYPVYYVTCDGGILCPDCAKMAEKEKLSYDPTDEQWYIIGCEVYYEGPPIQCYHCNGDIESAYGDPESEE